MGAVLAEIIDILVGGISGIATGIGEGLSALVTSIFLDTTGDTMKLSVFGGVIIIFSAVSLAIGLSRFVTEWVSSLGN